MLTRPILCLCDAATGREHQPEVELRRRLPTPSRLAVILIPLLVVACADSPTTPSSQMAPSAQFDCNVTASYWTGPIVNPGDGLYLPYARVSCHVLCGYANAGYDMAELCREAMSAYPDPSRMIGYCLPCRDRS